MSVNVAEHARIDAKSENKLNNMLRQMKAGKYSTKPMSNSTAAKNVSTVITIQRNQLPEVNSLDELHEALNSNANILSLDLEFYMGSDQTQHIGQIAGMIHNTHTEFNYPIFHDSNMNNNSRFKFLALSDLPYSQANILNMDHVMEQINVFCRNHRIDYICSYDNNLDFNMLNRTAKEFGWGEQWRFWEQSQTIDLHKILCKDVFETTTKGISLEHLIGVMRLNDGREFHTAINDVHYIDKLLQYYSRNYLAEIM